MELRFGAKEGLINRPSLIGAGITRPSKLADSGLPECNNSSSLRLRYRSCIASAIAHTNIRILGPAYFNRPAMELVLGPAGTVATRVERGLVENLRCNNTTIR